MNQNFYEINFDGIVGLTHNYGGLSYGNTASLRSKSVESNPKEAALQGLNKMKYLHSLGIKQAVLPPQERPLISMLQRLGFSGSNSDILSKAMEEAPNILIACSSAASMWAANAATITPSTDSQDALVHITPANLSSKFHRTIEVPMTAKILQVIFNNSDHFVHHKALPIGSYFSDEGAANHTRFCRSYDGTGFHLFNFGRYAFRENAFLPQKFPARQTAEASQAIARRHKIPQNQALFIQQNPEAIDAGVFHNDVISVGNMNVFMYHEKSFVSNELVIEEIQKRVLKYCYTDMHFIKVEEKQVPITDAVSSYLFNSQIVTTPDETMHLIAPTECETTPSVKKFLDELLKDRNSPIKKVHYIDIRQSMKNGGGPACLRLRVVLNNKELKAIHQGVLFDDQLYTKLTQWVKRHYRDKLQIKDLVDPNLLKENELALDELSKILKLGNIYTFQR